jgi:hypothetical protein
LRNQEARDQRLERFLLASDLKPLISVVMAERVGFEPTERFPVHSISSAANSTTLAPLHETQRLEIRD